MSVAKNRPRFSEEMAGQIAKELYGLTARAQPLPSERDQNFYLMDESGQEFVLKIASAAEQKAVLEFQNQAMQRLATHSAQPLGPRLWLTLTGEPMAVVAGRNGSRHYVRLLTYLPGVHLADIKPHTPELLHSLGRFLGTIDQAFEGFSHPAARRDLKWDMTRANEVIRRHLDEITWPGGRALLEHFLAQYETEAMAILPTLRRSVIHNDGNDYNILVETSESGAIRVTGMIDFGDMLHSYTVCDPAIAAAYVMLDKADPMAAAAHVVRGYHEVYPLTEPEIAVLYHLIYIRLCTSVAMSAHQQKLEPRNPYLSISERPAWALLEKLIGISSQVGHDTFRQVCKPAPGPAGVSTGPRLNEVEILDLRRRHLGKSLSIAYKNHLHIVRGWRQYLYDETGRAYLDGVNNVCHVGHCHPRIVEAARRQMALLNTNTRYLNEKLVTYAQRLAATLPDPLDVCFFVCSGSEANELALRLARTVTGQRDMIVVAGAYHGNTTALIEISPYKFDGPGGRGAPPYVHKVIMPDGYRGPYKTGDPQAGVKYAAEVRAAIERAQQQGHGIAGFICESLLSCGGQIVLPDNYLSEVYSHVRRVGGVCIADEVQVGFGRVGTHFWGFETQGVLPDIVTMGKPMGNGHPLAAVVTTPQIAEAFANGMEYFNTFGGNPVSCAVGLAVLDVIEDEKLQENALNVGARLKAGLEKLKEKHAVIGDVRGLGLFLGVEFVLDRQTLTPAAAQAAYIVERMKNRGILLSTDGPLHNVIKLKPPLVFSEDNADHLVQTLDTVLAEVTIEETGHT